jgi:photosynthetic reaction center H subunit
MPTGAITGYIDVAQIALYLFWAFFAGLIYYLHRENKREGYPLISDRSDRVKVQGFPAIPKPKTFLLPHGGSVQAPRPDDLDRRPIKAKPAEAFLGAPLHPTGDPMQDAVGPAAYAEREDKPEMTLEGLPMIVPLRVATECAVAKEDPDPRGMTVIGCDGQPGGKVKELWIDRAEPQIRYLEIATGGPRAKTVLVPMTLAVVHGDKRRVVVSSVTGAQVAGAPKIKSGDQITKLEEDKISAYFASGNLYATPERLGPLL